MLYLHSEDFDKLLKDFERTDVLQYLTSDNKVARVLVAGSLFARLQPDSQMMMMHRTLQTFQLCAMIRKTSKNYQKYRSLC